MAQKGTLMVSSIIKSLQAKKPKIKTKTGKQASKKQKQTNNINTDPFHGGVDRYVDVGAITRASVLHVVIAAIANCNMSSSFPCAF